MNWILRSLIKRLRVSVFPTEHDREVKRWFLDGGDNRLRYKYDLCPDSLVMDLGGFKGQWASDIYSRYNCHLLVFEPVQIFAAEIKERFRNNPNIEVFCMALGARRRHDTIGLCGDGSSMYSKGPMQERIQVEDVFEFFANRNIRSLDLMKVNIEGGEYELMSRLLEVEFVCRIKHIQIQFHNIGPKSEVLMKEICTELAKTHSPTYQYKFVWENWDRRDS